VVLEKVVSTAEHRRGALRFADGTARWHLWPRGRGEDASSAPGGGGAGERRDGWAGSPSRLTEVPEARAADALNENSPTSISERMSGSGHPRAGVVSRCGARRCLSRLWLAASYGQRVHLERLMLWEVHRVRESAGVGKARNVDSKRSETGSRGRGRARKPSGSPTRTLQLTWPSLRSGPRS
jgi:hypothetical protein